MKRMTPKTPPHKSRRLLVLLLLIFIMTLPGSRAIAQNLDQQLFWQDQFVAQQFASFPRDPRYDGVMTDIARRLNGVIVKTFGEDKDIIFHVCASRLGFNAVAFHRFIVFDSLLLDTLRYLAVAHVYYGGLDNNYINGLADSVAAISHRHRMGYIHWNQMNNENPFGLPPVPGQLTPEQQVQARELFINMLVSWMAHEGSHCMRDHVRHRMETAMRQNQNMDPNNPRQFNNNVSSYMNAKLTQKLEKDADIHATRWLVNAGYSVDGFIVWLRFGEILERKMGTDNEYLRTHPRCSDRIEYIVQEARRLGAYDSKPHERVRSSPVHSAPSSVPPYYDAPDDDYDDDYDEYYEMDVYEPVR